MFPIPALGGGGVNIEVILAFHAALRLMALAASSMHKDPLETNFGKAGESARPSIRPRRREVQQDGGGRMSVCLTSNLIVGVALESGVGGRGGW